MSDNFYLSFPNNTPGTLLDVNDLTTGFPLVFPDPNNGNSMYFKEDLQIFATDNTLRIRPRFGRSSLGNTIKNMLAFPVSKQRVLLTVSFPRVMFTNTASYNSHAIGIGIGRSAHHYVRANIERGNSQWNLRVGVRYATSAGTQVGNLNLSNDIVSSIAGATANTTIWLSFLYDFSTGEMQSRIWGDSTGNFTTPMLNLNDHAELRTALNSTLANNPIPDAMGFINAYNFDAAYTGNGHHWFQIYTVTAQYFLSTLASSMTVSHPTMASSMTAKSFIGLTPQTMAIGSPTMASSMTAKSFIGLTPQTMAIGSPTMASSMTAKSFIDLTPQPMAIGSTTMASSMTVGHTTLLNLDVDTPSTTTSSNLSIATAGTLTGNMSTPKVVSNANLVISSTILLDVDTSTSTLRRTSEPEPNITTNGVTLLNGYIEVVLDAASIAQIGEATFLPINDVQVIYENNTPFEVIFNLRESP